ncbi:MAG: hypothetical protein BGO28_07070 [Alphaproteobacteria bacterium 43-37]|nr:MAG: hypothetical protein BGO28_07070 [Alphaproteobacteria bacterium 43-37]
MPNEIKQIVEVMASERLDVVLKNTFAQFSRERLKALIKQGALRVNNEIIVDPSKKIFGQIHLDLTIPDPILSKPKAEEINLNVVYEDEHLLVINKPAGLVVHPGSGNHNGTLVNALLNYCHDSLSGIGGVLRPGIVHRLDKETSGLMLVAKGDAAHISLTEQFKNKSIYRIYHALVWGIPKQETGTINLPIARDTQNRKKMAVKARMGKPSVTHYTLLEAFGRNASLLECKLETGRTHQIRVHLSNIGHGLIADPVYKSSGNVKSKDLLNAFEALGPFPQRQALHAKKIRFIHPISEQEMIFESDYPEDFKDYLQVLFKHI